jgi:hypothetical protein
MKFERYSVACDYDDKANQLKFLKSIEEAAVGRERRKHTYQRERETNLGIAWPEGSRNREREGV